VDKFLEARKAEGKADKAAGGQGRRILKVPDDFMFFLRTIGLLRGLATTLEAKVRVCFYLL
jgi:hypothetical protein